jgi:hypothetical protein
MQVNGGSKVSVTVYEERERGERREREVCVCVRKMEKRHAVLVCEIGTERTHTQCHPPPINNVTYNSVT